MNQGNYCIHVIFFPSLLIALLFGEIVQMRDQIAFLNCQKNTARLILDQDPMAPSEPLFKQLGWMSIEQRIKYHTYLLVSKCIKNEAPVYSKHKIQYMSDRNPYSLQDVVSEKLQIPKAKTELFKKPFTYSGPKLWNAPPFAIRQASSHMHLKQKLKVSI